MNKVPIVCFILLEIFCSYSQGYEEDINGYKNVNQFEEVELFEKNEIRLNALDLIVQPALSIAYERLLSESNGYGVSLFVNFGEHAISYHNFSITPYYRFYFLNRKDYGTSGFFIEAFSSFSTVDFDEDRSSNSNEFQFSIGVGVGKKWVNRNGFTFELFAGVGRYFVDNGADDHDRPETHGRFGISIGKRF